MMRAATTSVAVGLALAVVLPAAPAAAAEQTIGGTVTVDERPLTGTSVTVGYWEPATGERVEVASSAVDGTYALSAPATGTYYLYANAEASGSGSMIRSTTDYAPVFSGAAGQTAYTWQDLTTMPVAAAAVDTDLPLDRSGTVRVASDDTSRMAEMRLFAAGGWTEIAQQQGGKDAFVFTGLVPGEYRAQSNQSTYAGYRIAWRSPSLTVRSGGTTTVAPRISSVSSGVRGVVTYRGRPVDKAIVSITRLVDGEPTVQDRHRDKAQLQVGPDGRYEIAAGVLRPGDYVVRARVSNLGDVGGLHVRIGGGSRPVRDVPMTRLGGIRLDRPSGTSPGELEGFALDGSGVAHGYRIADGDRLQIAYVPAGRYTAYLHDERTGRYGTRPVVVRSGEVTEVGSIPANRATVSVKGAVSGGAPGRSRSVRLTAAQARNALGTMTDQLPASSRSYTFDDVVPLPRYRLGVVPSGDDGLAQDLRVARDVRRDVTVPAPPGSVRGTLTWDGRPVGGLVALAPSYSRINARLDEGAFTVPGLAMDRHETYRLFVDTDDFVEGVPYWYEAPAATSVVPRPTAGKDVDLGDVEMTVAH